MVFLLEMVRAPITNWEITHTLCPRYGGSRGGENQGPSPHHHPPPPPAEVPGADSTLPGWESFSETQMVPFTRLPPQAY